MEETGLENIKLEDPACISPEDDIVKIELIEPIEIETKVEHETIDTDCDPIGSITVVSQPLNSIESIPEDMKPSKPNESLLSNAETPTDKPKKNNSWNDMSVPVLRKPKRT